MGKDNGNPKDHGHLREHDEKTWEIIFLTGNPMENCMENDTQHMRNMVLNGTYAMEIWFFMRDIMEMILK